MKKSKKNELRYNEDDTVLPIYVSNEKVLFNSDKYLSDLKVAESILSKIKERVG